MRCTRPTVLNVFFNYFGNSSTIIYLLDECLLWNQKTWILYHCSFRRNWFRNEQFHIISITLFRQNFQESLVLTSKKYIFNHEFLITFFCYCDDYQVFEISLPPIFRLVRKMNKYVVFTIYLKHVQIFVSAFFCHLFFFPSKMNIRWFCQKFHHFDHFTCVDAQTCVVRLIQNEIHSNEWVHRKTSYAQCGHNCTKTMLNVFRSAKSLPTELYHADDVCIEWQTFTRTANELERQKERC